jgi:hypothetical protein
MAKPLWHLRPQERRAQQAADKKATEDQKKVLLSKLVIKKTKPVQKSKTDKYPEQGVITSNSPPQQEIEPTIPRTHELSAIDHLQFYSRSNNSNQLHIQPWARDMVATFMQAAENGGIHLCLAWPARFDSLVTLHALANFERVFGGDLYGMRTLLYPGAHNSRSALQGVLIERTQLSDQYRSLWGIDGSKFTAHTRSSSFEAMLSALNDIRSYHPEAENPSFGEIFPVFVYDPSRHAWMTTVHSPLERSLTKVERLAYRRDIRKKVNAEWGNLGNAPCALMVLHNASRKDAWKDALANKALINSKPEVFLLDATSLAAHTNYGAVNRIPDFLRYALDHGYQGTGAVIITDDPKTFFILRSRLNALKLDSRTQVWAAEGDEAVLSAQAHFAEWVPDQRSNANFSVGIVDRDASQVAMAFQRFSQESGTDDSPSHRALMAACLYILRLSNMPAGYSDLTAEAAIEGDTNFSSQHNAWTPVRLGLSTILQSGDLNDKRSEVEKTISKAERLIDAWGDATPMAARLLAEVRKYAIDGQDGLSIVLPNKKYIQLAHRFLQRKLGDAWELARERMDWHTLASVGRTLMDNDYGRHLIFVGVNHNVLRLLITHKHIPHGTTVLIAYKQADSAIATLSAMKEVEAFKPYRGRLCLLLQEIERRLKEVPNPIMIGKLGEMTMTFRLEDNDQHEVGGDQQFYKFDLEGGERAYASSYVYQYAPNEDPFFRRVRASSIAEGDFIFEMNEELRDKLESALHLKINGLSSAIHPERTLLKLYHEDVKLRCSLLFKAKKRSALAREIRAKMIELDPKASECRPGRIYYWLALQDDGDTRPHAPKDAKFFKIFCQALEMNEDQALQNWNFIRNARRLNQNLGRELSARYAEILFRPESARVYRNVPDSIISQLRQDALTCVYRVEHVIPPQALG